ncbi:MAG: Hsp70 family protein [Planctomycetaceae bacterium]|jgi:molecular chaperone DnaK|nr:Hsp70 family protein [Planctomycetaceae bacterium]
METILGIDLGTTNSEVSVIHGNDVVVIEKDGHRLLPSVVGIDLAGNLLVGHPAKNQAILYPERTVKSIKRKMGEDVRIKLGDREYTPPEISAMILRTLRSYAEESLGQKVTKAVITVPAFFNDTQREATRLAGELAGLDVVRIINEPTAASLVYNSNSTLRETLLVYDLGGGTFDVSIVRVEDGVLEVLASHGDTHLGGDDFDQLLFDYVCEAFKKQYKTDLRETPVAVSRVLQAVEEAKKRLSTEPFTQIKEEFITEKDGASLHLDMELSRHQYEEQIFPLLEKTLTCLNDALNDAQLHPDDIDKVIMVGGASRTPIVHQLLESRVGNKLHGEIDPDLCVTMGAAIQGGLISGAKVGRVLIDITPHTLGTSVFDSRVNSPFVFSPIIKRNTPVPCSRSNVYGTVFDNQESVEVNVYQGEADDVRQNALIGEFLLTGLAKVPRNNQIICRFDLDINGILHVTAIEKNTGRAENITVENALAEHRPEANRLFRDHLNSFFAGEETIPDESEKEEEDSESTIDDKDFANQLGLADGWEERYAKEAALIQRASAFISKVTGDDRKDLETRIRELVDAVNRNDSDQITSLVSQLDDLVYYLEDSV